MKNKLIDIHNILMATLEDLDDEELLNDKDKLNNIIKVTTAKASVARTIIDLDRLALDTINSQASHCDKLPDVLNLIDKPGK